jgi:hypothetical protein
MINKIVVLDRLAMLPLPQTVAIGGDAGSDANACAGKDYQLGMEL